MAISIKKELTILCRVEQPYSTILRPLKYFKSGMVSFFLKSVSVNIDRDNELHTAAEWYGVEPFDERTLKSNLCTIAI